MKCKRCNALLLWIEGLEELLFTYRTGKPRADRALDKINRAKNRLLKLEDT